jgi:hypothetical protein
MLEMLELSSRAASSAKLDCRQRAAMRVSEASHDRCRPTHHLQIDPESAALFQTIRVKSSSHVALCPMTPAGPPPRFRTTTPPRAFRYLDIRLLETT